MNKLNVGFSKVNINPPLGISIAGYYVPRFAKGFLDDTNISGIALECDGNKILIMSVDVCLLKTAHAKLCTEKISEATGVSKDNIFITATHSHTAADVGSTLDGSENEVINEYTHFVTNRMVDAAVMALADLAPAKMGFATGWAPERVAYIRRYRMKDGSTFTCPPINDPDIVGPIGELDQRVHVLRFTREGAEDVVIVNYGVHADTVNGELISADWPHWMYKTLDKALDGVKCIFIAGAQGDVGSTNVHPSGGDMNDTEISFDNEMKSPGMARFVGRALAGTVLQVYDKVEYVDVDSIEMIQKAVVVPANVPDPKDLPLAHKYKELHEAGRDDEIPFKAMQLTTVVAEAIRMCDLENGPYEFSLGMCGIRLGKVALVGIPGEPFTEVGVKIKDTEGFDMIMPCGLVNGYEGYFPVKAAFDEGGYEARTSRYKTGVAEAVVANGKEILEILKK